MRPAAGEAHSRLPSARAAIVSGRYEEIPSRSTRSNASPALAKHRGATDRNEPAARRVTCRSRSDDGQKTPRLHYAGVRGTRSRARAPDRTHPRASIVRNPPEKGKPMLPFCPATKQLVAQVEYVRLISHKTPSISFHAVNTITTSTARSR